MYHIRNDVEITLSASTTRIFVERFLESKPLQQETHIMNSVVKCRLNVTRRFLDVVVVSEEGRNRKGITLK